MVRLSDQVSAIVAKRLVITRLPVRERRTTERLSTLVDFPSCRLGSNHGIASEEFDTEEFADGDDLDAALY